MAHKQSSDRVVAQNRKARYDFTIVESLEAGIVLTGSEVKSLRAGRASLVDSYARPQEGELYLVNAHIPVYPNAGRFNHEPLRARKLLLKKREMAKMFGAVQRDGASLVPLKIYFNARGIAKLELGLARGKKQYDKRETEKRRDWDRQRSRLIRAKG